MGYKSIIGALSNSSSIVKYSDDERAWQIYTRWKNGKPKLTLRRRPDTIPYDQVAEYTTFLQTDQTHAGGVGWGIAGGLAFGPLGAIGGFFLGDKTVQTIKQLGFAMRTTAGDEYVIPLIYSIKGERSDKPTAKTALNSLQRIESIFQRNGTPAATEWTTDIDAWRNL